MKYNGTIYRPPVEANTFLLPITEGCTHNSCTFCNMYQDIPFRMLSLSEVEEYLREVKQNYGRYCERIQRVYLVGADPFALSARRLPERIELIKKYLPNTKVITMYARTDNIAAKSDEDLKALKEAGVDDLYIGVECGLNDVLETLNKGYSADDTKREFLAGLELPDCYFWALHPLDSVKVDGILRDEKQRILQSGSGRRRLLCRQSQPRLSLSDCLCSKRGFRATPGDGMDLWRRVQPGRNRGERARI
ncbi:MAG: radical SAM protein [Blautia sp.]|nr:radical SAM protein [Blautia sp.]